MNRFMVASIVGLVALGAGPSVWAGAERELGCDQDWVLSGPNNGDGLITITSECDAPTSLVVESLDRKGNVDEVGKVGPGETRSFFFRVKSGQTISILGADAAAGTYTATIDPL